MKQNERLLVYAVTGFLALILLVAVVFGRAPENKSTTKTGGAVQKLEEMAPGIAAASNGPTANPGGAPQNGIGGADMLEGRGMPDGRGMPQGNSGLPAPGQLVPEQPLMAQAKPMVAADLVAQSLGLSRRERNVRFVRAKAGDSLDTLVRRWCGARDPFLAEAQSLNEDLLVLRVGQEVALPWVDDELLAAGLEQQKPKAVLVDSPVDLARLAAEANSRRSSGVPVPAVGNPVVDTPPAASAMATTTYVVKKGDALWRIAERTYGRKNADRMVGEIKAVNPGLSDSLREGQKIQLPKADATKVDAPKVDVAAGAATKP